MLNTKIGIKFLQKLALRISTDHPSKFLLYVVSHNSKTCDLVLGFRCISIGKNQHPRVTESAIRLRNTVELQQLWNHENMFETGVVRAYECKS